MSNCFYLLSVFVRRSFFFRNTLSSQSFYVIMLFISAEPFRLTMMSGVVTDEIASKISTDVLKMNFMRRTQMKIEKAQKAREQQATRNLAGIGKVETGAPRCYVPVEHIDDDPNITLGGVMSEWRYTVLEDLRFGRFSYKGQNPEIEKLMLFHERRRLGLADDEEENLEEEERALEESSDEMEEGDLSEEDERPSSAVHMRLGKRGQKRSHRRRNVNGPGMKEEGECSDEDAVPSRKRFSDHQRIDKSRHFQDSARHDNNGGRGQFGNRRSKSGRGNRGQDRRGINRSF